MGIYRNSPNVAVWYNGWLYKGTDSSPHQHSLTDPTGNARSDFTFGDSTPTEADIQAWVEANG